MSRAIRIDLLAEARGLAVDADAARGDERLGGAARSNARGGEDLLDSFLGHRRQSPGEAPFEPASVLVVEREEQRATLLGEASRDVGVERREVVERLEPEALQELEGRAVQDRAARGVRAPQLHHEPPVEKAPDGVIRVDAADPLHGRLGDRLAVGHDGEGLEPGRREADRVRPDIARDQRSRCPAPWPARRGRRSRGAGSRGRGG